MLHNGFIYEARMDMMESSGHWLIWFKSTKMKVRPYFLLWNQLEKLEAAKAA